MERKIVRDVVENSHATTREPGDSPRSSFLSRERREERRGQVIEQSFEKQSRVRLDGGGRGFAWWHAALIVLAVFAVLFIWLTLSSEAEVLVSPRERVVEVDSALKAYLEPETPLLLGYSVKTDTAKEEIVVKSTGTKYVERKAGGKLTVYNSYSKDPVKIISNTRFKSEAGLVFRTYSSFFVPGYKTVAGSVEPGKIEISVTADQPGSDYNVGPSDFTLPGLVGSAMAKGVYAKSQSAMTGGFKGDAPVIDDEDLDKAKATLENKLSQVLVAKINENLGEQGVLFDGAYNIDFKFSEYDSSAASAEGENKLSMEGTIHAVIFQKDALSRIIARRELSGVGEESVLISNWPEMEVDLTSYDNLAAAKEISLRVRGDAEFVWQFSKEMLASDLANVPKKEYSKVFANYPSIESATVDIKPFWKANFPSDPVKIIIELAPTQS